MQNMTVRYPHLFTGLGAFPENNEIKLNHGGQPFAQFMPRDVFLTPRKTAQGDLMRIKLFGLYLDLISQHSGVLA